MVNTDSVGRQRVNWAGKDIKEMLGEQRVELSMQRVELGKQRVEYGANTNIKETNKLRRCQGGGRWQGGLA